MNNVLKGIVIAFMILYIISPVDGCPGHIDDLLVLIIGCAANKSLTDKNNYDNY